MIRLSIFLLFFFSLSANALAQTFLGKTLTIDSNVLGQQRELLVSLPSNYQTEKFYHYPVLYITDADSQFNHIAATIELLNGTISPMIVVGIKQQERMAELAPFAFDKSLSQSSDKFRRFIIDEVKPFISQQYRTANFSMLSGHSIGGAFVLNAYYQDKDSFDGFLALSPTLAWGNEQLLTMLPEVYKQQEQPKLATVFEGQSPFPTPKQSYQALNELNKQYAHLATSHSNTLLEQEDHVSVSHLGAYLTLTELYRGWFLSVPKLLASPTAFDGHYQQLTDKLGYTVQPTENELWQLTQALLGAKKLEDATRVVQKAKAYYPNSKFSYVLLADIAKAQDDKDKEKGYLLKAISLANDDEMRKQRYQKRLAKL
ncbi:alpha/beta hydrolase-fold protein [Thalassotalea maritima]|uniref:alpha/beta hydrolase-fold protein n=1 Tax=Thalassotalea maritima TaxID=3242416 RepID=UPI0035295AB3